MGKIYPEQVGHLLTVLCIPELTKFRHLSSHCIYKDDWKYRFQLIRICTALTLVHLLFSIINFFSKVFFLKLIVFNETISLTFSPSHIWRSAVCVSTHLGRSWIYSTKKCHIFWVLLLDLGMLFFNSSLSLLNRCA